MAIDMTGNDPGSKAAANITKLIEAAANAKTAQVELQKQVMLKRIGDKMDIQKNIEQKQANINWLGDLSNQEGSPAEGGAPNNVAGVANASTPATMGAPPTDAMSMSPQASQAPQSPTPMLTAAAQPRPNPPSLSGPTAMPTPINSSTVTAPKPAAPVAPTPPSVQYTNLGYQPVEAPQLAAMRRQSGQTVNVADAAYVQALNKVKAGTASDSELAMVNKMNNRSKDGSAPPPDNTETLNLSPVQKGLAKIEDVNGLPRGSMWVNPATGEPEINPIAKSKLEAVQRAQANYDVNQPFREKLEQDRLEKQADDRLQQVIKMRSGGLGLQDMKVNQAIDLRRAINSYYDSATGNYNVPPTMHTEIALGLARLLSPNGQVGVELTRELKQGTLAENMRKVAIYMGGNPTEWGGPTQSVMKTLVGAIDRQGSTSEELRDKYLSDAKDVFPKNLDPNTKEYLKHLRVGSSFNDVLKLSPDQQQDSGSGSSMVTMTSPSGKQYSFSADQADEARKNGWK